jgi:uncharacterized protein YcgL (UPF0745 family)
LNINQIQTSKTMTKNQKIGWTVFGLILAGAAVGTILYIQKKKKADKVPDLDTVDPSKISDSTKSKVGDNQHFDHLPEVIKLKDDLSKAYYAMEIMENKGGVVYNKSTGKPVANGLDQGVWIQLKKRKNELAKEYGKSVPKNSGQEFHGLALIGKMNLEVDRIFDPSKYNTNQVWFKEYIKKYPEGIKGTA